MTARARSNPLALAVLCTLNEHPAHPYEISQTLRTRAKHESIRLNFGSLYGVVAGLERRRLIRAVETVREGKRPERTVYDITETGRREMYDWLSELIATPVKEYLQFEAGLSLIGALPPDETVALLRQRCDAIELQLEQAQAVLDAMAKRGMPRLFALEGEYMAALQQAELEFTRMLVADIESGELSGLDEWHSWHEGGPGWAWPPETDDAVETGQAVETRQAVRADRAVETRQAVEPRLPVEADRAVETREDDRHDRGDTR